MSSFNVPVFLDPFVGGIVVPGSKSITNRVLVLAALSHGKTCIRGALKSEDSEVMIAGLRKMGIQVKSKVKSQKSKVGAQCLAPEKFEAMINDEDAISSPFEKGGLRGISNAEEKISPSPSLEKRGTLLNFSVYPELIVYGNGGKFDMSDDLEIHCKNSGTTIRFLSAVAALRKGKTIFTGIDRMKQRPIGDLAHGLKQLGVVVEFLEKEGFPPLSIVGNGKLLGKTVQIPGKTSSQFITALLQIASFAEDAVAIEIQEKVVSFPYLQMSVEILRQFGAKITVQNNFQKFTVQPSALQMSTMSHAPALGTFELQRSTYCVEGDASSATYPLAIAAITGGEIFVQNICSNKLQGDTNFSEEVLQKMGCVTNISEQGIYLKAPQKLHPLGEINLESMPDAAMTAIVLAAYADGVSRISGLSTLKYKECDRIEALSKNLQKMGAKVFCDDDVIEIAGNPRALRGAEIDSYNDHRVAMCFSVLGSVIEGVTILNPECVQKTWPSYWQEYAQWRMNHLS